MVVVGVVVVVVVVYLKSALGLKYINQHTVVVLGVVVVVVVYDNLANILHLASWIKIP